jgi:hypothetical protein
VAGLNKTHIVLLSTETVIKPDEQELLQTQLNSSVHLREIDDVIKEAIRIMDRAELDVAAVLGNLRQMESIPTTTMYWVAGISVCILLITTICRCYYKESRRDWSRIMLGRAVRQRSIPQPRQRNKAGTGHSSEYASTVDTVLPLKVIATHSSGEEQEAAETEQNEIGRAPTPFVSRGRVPVS